MAYTPPATSTRLRVLAAAILTVFGGLSFPFTLGLAILTMAYTGFYDGSKVVAVAASAAALPVASVICSGASAFVLNAFMTSRPTTATALLLGVAAAALPLAFAFWQIVAWWVAR